MISALEGGITQIPLYLLGRPLAARRSRNRATARVAPTNCIFSSYYFESIFRRNLT